MNSRRKDTVRKNVVKAITATALGAAGILLSLFPASAANLDVTPSISLDQTYDSNIFNTNGNEKGDFILRATPAVTFSLRMPETTLNLRTSLTSDTYYKYSEQNSNSSAVSLALDATPIGVTQRLSIAPAAHYVEARDSYRRTQLLPAGDPQAPPSIASETATGKNRDYGGALRVGYLVTPNVDFTIGGGFSKRQFLDNVSGEVGSRVVTGDTSVSYRYTPLFSPGLFLHTAYNTFDNGAVSRTYAGGLTGMYRFSPALTLNARAGGSRTQESGVPGVPERTTWGPYGSLFLAYTAAEIQAALNASVDQSGGGSFGLTTRTETIALSISDNVSARWGVDLSGTFQRNRSLDAATSEDLTSAAGTAGVRYQAWEWAIFHLSCTAFQQWSNGTAGTDLKRYSAFFGVTLGKTYNIY